MCRRVKGQSTGSFTDKPCDDYGICCDVTGFVVTITGYVVMLRGMLSEGTVSHPASQPISKGPAYGKANESG
jgi:hypothetical protein